MATILALSVAPAQVALAEPPAETDSSPVAAPSLPPSPSSTPTDIGTRAEDDPVSSLSLTKTVTPTRVTAVGQLLSYHLVATNTGTTTLGQASISDELPGLSSLSCTPAQPAALAAGDTLDCTATRAVSQADLDFGVIANVATVSAEAPGGDPDDPSDDVTALADASVDARQQPSISLVARSSLAKASTGDRLTAQFTVTNTGNVTLTRARVLRGLTGLSALSCRPSGATFAPGDQLSCSGHYTVTKADGRRGSVSLRGTARAEHPFGQVGNSTDDVVATASVKVSVVAAAPAAGGNGGDRLPETGGPSGWIGAAGILFAAAGAGTLWLRRRRLS